MVVCVSLWLIKRYDIILFTRIKIRDNTDFVRDHDQEILSDSIDIKKSNIISFWDSFDFSTDSYVNNPVLLKQPTLTFLQLLQQFPEESETSLVLLTDKVLKADSIIIQYMMDELFEKYLYRPDSPIRNDNNYLVILEQIIRSERINNLNKTRFIYQQHLIMQNQIGSIANNFDFNTIDDKPKELINIDTEYLILFFNNPECISCKDVISILDRSDLINEAIDAKKLKILSIYPDDNKDLWKKAIHPYKWLNGINLSQTIYKESLYDLRAIPSLYLLNTKKRVLIKDGTVEEILHYLQIALNFENKTFIKRQRIEKGFI